MSLSRLVPSVSVRLRILALAAIPVLAVAANGIAYMSGERQFATAFGSFEHAASLVEAAREFDGALGRMRNSARDFTETPNEELIKKFRRSYRDALESLKVLETTVSTRTPIEIFGRQKVATKLDRALTNLEKEQRLLGFDDSEGIRGRLQQARGSIDGVLKEGLPWLRTDDARRLLSALVSIRLADATDQVESGFSSFDANLDAVAGDAAKKAQLRNAAESYVQTFREWKESTGNVDTLLGIVNQDTDDLLAGENNEISAARREAGAASAALASAQQHTRSLIVVVAIIVVGVALVFSLLIGRGITRPLSALTTSMNRLASGNFDVTLAGLDRSDEIGEMAKAVARFKTKAVEQARSEAEKEELSARAAAEARAGETRRLARSFEDAVGNIAVSVSSAATELEAEATSLSHTAEKTQQLSGDVTGASEKSSASVQWVATATEELSASIAEISRQVQESSRIAGEAVQQASFTDARVTELSKAASRIGDVVKLISSIAEQTNLLALNATIEAARAGETGKGFAIVAAEVKLLATQTAKATDEIDSQITEMQSATRDSVAAIKDIGATITHISEISVMIASAVEQQGATIRDVAGRVSEAAHSTTLVAADIGDVSQGASETGMAATRVLGSAHSLSREGARLKTEVDKFLTMVRAG